MTLSVGYRWLVETYGLSVVQPLPVETSIGPTRQRSTARGTEHRSIRVEQAPAPELGPQLSYALKHEGVHLELLARLFGALPSGDLEAWIRSAPTGQYRRRVGFLFEALTHRTLDVSPPCIGNYVKVLDPDREFAAERTRNNARWRVVDNLLGTPHYCPQVRRSLAVDRAMAFDVAARIGALECQFSPELIQRSAMWLSVKESRASFAIEHEARLLDRVHRFARVIETRTGAAGDPLDPEVLSELQRAILGADALHLGIRKSPIFVGETDRYGQELVHYVAPQWQDLPELLAGLRATMLRTAGQSPIARAAIASFGFVYLHPMVDGNGRISRFLINDTLRRDGVLPSPYILPVSALLQDAGLRPINYDAALELYSRPFTQHYQQRWSFGPSETGADGVRYNFSFDAWQEAQPAWRFPDMSRHVVFMADLLERTIDQEMHAEARYLQKHQRARLHLKELFEAPNNALDRIIRSVRDNRGVISGKLVNEYPRLEDSALAERVVRIVLDALGQLTDADRQIEGLVHDVH